MVGMLAASKAVSLQGRNPRVGYAHPVRPGQDPAAAAVLIDQNFNSGALDQYKRELVSNAIQHGKATKVRVDAYRFEQFGETGGIKSAYVDNGCGMPGDKIVQYFGSLFRGASQIGPDKNFQIGARSSTLPWNHGGLVIASWVEGDPVGSLVTLVHDADTDTYQVWAFEDEYGRNIGAVGEPEPGMKHPIIEAAGHGTAVFLVGATEEDHTVGKVRRDNDGTFVYPNRWAGRDDWQYLNGKYWALPNDVDIRVMWGNGDLDERWMKRIAPGHWHHEVKTVVGNKAKGIKGEVWGHRTVFGVQERIRRDASFTYNPSDPTRWDNKGYSGQIAVQDARGYKALVHWAIFSKDYERTGEQSGGMSGDTDTPLTLGLFGELYQNEVYGLTYGKNNVYLRTMLERYGIIDPDLRKRVVLIVEPEDESATTMATTSNGARSHLIHAGNPLPHFEWGESFNTQIKTAAKPIADFLFEKTNPGTGAEARKKLFEQLKKWFIRSISNAGSEAEPMPKPRSNPNPEPQSESDSDQPKRERRPHFSGGPKNVLRDAVKEAVGNMQDVTVEWDARQFEESGVKGLLARWSGSPSRTIYINGDHEHLKELINDELLHRKAAVRDRAKDLIVEAIKDHMYAHVVCVRLIHSSTKAGEAISDPAFVDEALTGAALSAVLANEPNMRLIITKAMQGHTGFKRIGV
jgi:hypothetical protein